MSSLILPEIVKANMARAALAERHEGLRWFERELKELDPLLELVKASDQSTDADLIPGYWHIRRRNVIGLDTYIAITGPNGEFCEPNSAIIEALKRDDLQRAGSWERFCDRLDAEERAHQARVREQREALKEEFMDRYKAKASPGVRVTREL